MRLVSLFISFGPRRASSGPCVRRPAAAAAAAAAAPAATAAAATAAAFELQAFQSSGAKVVRSARVPLLYPRSYAREKRSVRESEDCFSPLALGPKRPSLGRTFHYRKRMYSICRFRTKLTFRRNILLKVLLWGTRKTDCFVLGGEAIISLFYNISRRC